ncbi:Acetyltransferase (GNAT) domain-containing protein [Mucilaginibacter gossypiicola]|uniref:Acetyltransferase (GNAT) domain-containing protein n=1 Tax=Mucilaginibacter gossypiicola TaxID=551995 RepID=A0A1H8GRK7_9SPHI|nr:GNAT family N-acetyltransferase [Mucilaginibacter gossypiicola]SEN46672.1 Acetyltransferase (GNAT) domain-containing protein [Mucilaginibacter gossypiicola]
MIKIFTLLNKEEWISYVGNSAEYDFYHTWHYHSLETAGDPVLFVYEEADTYIGFPLLQRKIPGSDYCDLTCVYGFSGPFSNQKFDEIDEVLMENFKTAFSNFLVNEKYVSVFVRLHPFYKQQKLLEKFGGIHENGKTVVFDLSLTIDEQRKKYRQSTMDAIKHAWKRGFRVEDETNTGLNTFVEIYTENMKRVGANSYYLFNEKYFSEILNTSEYEARLLTVYDKDIAIASTIISFTNGIIQAHLVGARAEYLHHSPTKFLADCITQIGREKGMKYYNLGGGLGFKNDKLFDWKCAFSDFHLDFKTWRYIANPEIYQKLLQDKGIEENAEVDFFPLYRYA